MTSSTAPPGVYGEIIALFSWNPPPLIHVQGSPATRPPSFYDKHFSPTFVLKRVVRLPSLVQVLAKNVDTALNAALPTLPPLRGFITAEMRGNLIRITDKRVPDEKAVTNFYYETTGKFCVQVASMLALHPKAPFSRWSSLLSWTQSSHPPTNYVIMDGRLCFIANGADDKTSAAIVESMENEDRRIFEEMKRSVSALATWEMTSTSAGPAEVMNAVLNLGTFNWTFCNPSGNYSSKDRNHMKAKADSDVEKVRVGFDAKDSLWNLPDDPENRDEETDIQPLASSSATLQRPVTERLTRSAALGSSMPQPTRSSGHGSPTKAKGKKRKRDDDEAYQDHHEKTAQSLVQQAWAQAAKVDGTVIVLHSGNHEIVCVRRRDSQTLYVSDVIEPPTCVEPGYGKLHVGIYMAAVRDAMNRWKEKPPGDGGGDLINGDQDQDDQDDQDHNRGPGSGRNRGAGRGHRKGRRRGGHRVGKSRSVGFKHLAGRKTPGDELVAIEKAIHVASNRNVVLLYLQYDASGFSIFSASHPHLRTRGMSTIVLTSEIGRGSTGVVHRGTLEPEVCDGAMPLDVVVKLAFDAGQRDGLKSEYKVYRRLRSKGVLQGIPTILGLFDDSEGAACALVMLYAGVPLVKEPERNLSVSVRKSALSTLKSIHHAGILHGDIRRDNILMGDLGVAIIDFGHSERCDNQKAKDEEIAQLRYLLGLARESH